MKTVIMAGGRGTRIESIAANIPKPMIPVAGVPVLEREIKSLTEQGFTDIIITVSHLSSVIIKHFADGAAFNAKIQYFVEETALGNAGALFKLRDQLGEEPFLLLNADAVFDVDFNRMLKFHQEKKARVTLFTHPNSHPFDSGLLIADAESSVVAWLTKEDIRPQYYKNRVNAGIHIIDPAILDMVDVEADRIGTPDPSTGSIIKVDLDRQLLKPLAGTGLMFCYDSPEYVKDMGTPERFRMVESDFQSGKITQKNLKNMQKAVFLDRDGTINIYKGFLRNIDDFELTEGIAEAVRKINESGYLCIVITNQPVIARGELSCEALDEIHNKMETLLGIEGAYIDGLYYCPHHPHGGYEGEIPELKIDCDCRKPRPGMLIKASEDFHIDLGSSFMVGDGENDVKAGLAAGCRSILINGSGTARSQGAWGQTDTLESVLSFTEKYL